MNYKEIYVNRDYLVINKQAGFLTHGAKHLNDTNLADELLKSYPEIARVGDDPFRPGIIHRLDKLASGLLVVARRPDSFDSLKLQFQNRTIVKKYTALVFGKIDQDEDEITFPIQRSSVGYKMAALPKTVKGEANTSGRQAISEFVVVKRFINYTLLKVRIKTGRTHQIRVHLSAYGHPLVGDDLYGTKKTKVKNTKLNLGRIFLVADYLEFKDLQGEKQSFQIELPEELQNFLDNLR